MAAAAYLLLPVTGLFAFTVSHRPRVRFHGLQAIVIGAVWGILLYAASALSSVATIFVSIAGALLWVGFFIATALGRDPRLPFFAGLTDLLVQDDPA